MLNFSNIKVALIYLIFITISFLTFLNFQNDTKFFDRKINLGLDYRGSYLLLEIETESLVNERLQAKVLPIKKFLNDNKINYKNFKIKKNSLNFDIDLNALPKFESIFMSKDKNNINPYFDNYRSHELMYETKSTSVTISFSKYGLLTLNNSALNQSIEIVRRRIDDLGTKEPTILQSGIKEY